MTPSSHAHRSSRNIDITRWETPLRVNAVARAAARFDFRRPGFFATPLSTDPHRDVAARRAERDRVNDEFEVRAEADRERMRELAGAEARHVDRVGRVT